MKSYLITVPVEGARGFQQYAVKAESDAEAIEMHNAGSSDFVGEEVEVTKLGEPKAELNE